MAYISKLNVNFNYGMIEEKFDFFKFVTREKYIKYGSRLLDSPIHEFKAESVVFDDKNALYSMFPKGAVTKTQLMESIDDKNVSVKEMRISEIEMYIALKLFLFGISNYKSESIKFNNITGKLFVVDPKWIDKNGRKFKALNLDVDRNMTITARATCFTEYSFTDGNKYENYAKYKFANNNHSLVRVFTSDGSKEYIRKTPIGRKTEIPFLDLKKDGVKNNKAFYICWAIKVLNKRYEELLSVGFDKLNIYTTIEDYREKNWFEIAFNEFCKKPLNIISFVSENEYRECFESVINAFKQMPMKVGVCGKVDPDAYNIVLIHDKEYYEGKEDPYKTIKKTNNVQCMTVEDCATKIVKDNDAVIKTIIKELVIKDDINFKKRISIDDWSSYGFKDKWFFGRRKDESFYFIEIDKDGSLCFYEKSSLLSSIENKQVKRLMNYMLEDNFKNGYIVADCFDNINIIEETPLYTLPSPDIFELDFISRSESSRRRYLSGIVDINLYETKAGCDMYSVGMKGKGMNTSIPKASHLYNVKIVKGENMMPKILKTLSVSFVKFNSYTVLPYPIKYLNEYVKTTE